MYYYQKFKQLNKEPPFEEDKVLWFIRPGFYEPGDWLARDAFEIEILKRLKGESSDANYELTQDQLDDIITCAASKYIRDAYTMKYKYTDLFKVSNYIGFESGVICFYPNLPGMDYLETTNEEEDKFGCYDNPWYHETYLKDAG